MKTTNEQIKNIIKEILEQQDGLGKSSVSKSSLAKNLKQRSADTSSQKGVDNIERGIIEEIEKKLTKLAELSNLKSGNLFSFLKRINSLMEKEIKKIEAKGSPNKLNESLSTLIKNKSLDKETVEKVDNKLSDNEGYQLAKQLFSIIAQEDTEESNNLEEGPLDWMKNKYLQAQVDGGMLIDMLKEHPKFAPILKLSPALLALAYTAVSAEVGNLNAQTGLTAAEIMIKKGKLDVNSLADMMNEQRKIDG